MRPFPTRAALIVALASIGVLATAGTAAATVTPTVNGNALTVIGDGANDAITLAATAGVVTVNGAATTLAADANAQIVVDGGAGDDTVDATGLGANYGTLTINGGEGQDSLTGGAKADTLGGGTGGDRLTGFKGVDAAAGGAGDDVMVWNNGDASDSNQGGGGFDTTEVNGSPTAGDVMQLSGDANATTFARTNLIAFTIDIDPDVELLAVNGLGGEDQFTGLSTAVGPAVIADGGADDDRLVGGGESDSLFGGSGDDRLTPGAGSDLADGEDGADSVFARDGAGDLVRGGAGTDSAQTDAVNVDLSDGIEALDATPVPAPPAPDDEALLPDLGVVRVASGHDKLSARLRLTCPVAETGGCDVTATMTTAKPVRLGGLRASLVLGSGSASVAAGQSAALRVRLARGTAALARHGKLASRVRIVSSDAAGNLAERTQGVRLRIPRG